MILTEDKARKVYDILCRFGGANSSQYEIDYFVYSMTHEDIAEWRFCGNFGFGGKYWSDANRVSCYREDETEDILKQIELINNELLKLC